ncbi:tRNA (adenosine(37)-N6)-threonylcarbamoyltransferase complex ATPase subunit type 1 TsaE [Candidatus Bipolaricaulota bacterium]|nr:tRNA (adenosine(37)-N6)-threonylcarbamoyltransferase complex ATPase subunit type 1 TsaE [Candidatus Bipolaricaulota bacterium]
MQEFRTGSPEETEKIGKQLISQFGKGSIFCLYGPLAAGKTTLVKGLAKALGVAGTIVSPSYVLLRQYEGDTTLFHLDLFRIQTDEEFVEAGLDEYLLQPEGVVAIEWAGRIENILPAERIDIELELIGKDARLIRVDAST